MKIKAALIAVVFVLFLGLAVFIRQQAAGNFSVHRVDFFDTKQDWLNFKLDNLLFSKNGDFLLLDSLAGDLESPPAKTVFPFDQLLLSWNCRATLDDGLDFAISVSPDNKTWYDFKYLRWGTPVSNTAQADELPEKITGIGYLDKDLLKLEKPMNYYRFALTCIVKNEKNRKVFGLDRITVCYSDTKASLRLYHQEQPVGAEISAVSLAIPFISQHSLPDSLSGKACSQTCLTMVLNYYGSDYSSVDVSELVYDKTNDTYGNWPYNVQAAYLMGVKKAWIGRHNSFNELTSELNEGKPVIISISFENHLIAAAPYTRTGGHLIVVRGFNKNGDVLVNDPYGKNAAAGVKVYKLAQLTKAWVDHGGVAYHLWP